MRAYQIALLLPVVFLGCRHAALDNQRTTIAVATNESYIAGLYSAVHFSEPMAVFQRLFETLPSAVHIYPSENYYYFVCTISGAQIQGSLALLADSRDRGILTFSYEEVSSITASTASARGVELELSRRNGVRVRKSAANKYAVTYAGKTVSFVLDDGVSAGCHDSTTASDETCLANILDESGLRFRLVFHGECNTFYWILDESMVVPERFDPDYQDILLGVRTGFVFLEDPRRRKILIGVSARNVLENNWNDGPFDQLPDNAIRRHEVTLKRYIELRYPSVRGKIDDYGVFLKNREMRVAIAPYVEYANVADVRTMAGAIQAMSQQGSDFYQALSEHLRRAELERRANPAGHEK